jgi:hypothetical protein
LPRGPLLSAPRAPGAMAVGEDPESAFWVPFAGPPVPMHGACLAEVPDDWAPEDADADQDASARLAETPAPEGAGGAGDDPEDTGETELTGDPVVDHFRRENAPGADAETAGAEPEAVGTSVRVVPGRGRGGRR